MIVCGGREFTSRAKVYRAMDAAHAKRPITLLVHPLTLGAVIIATEWADERGIRTVAVIAQRDTLTGSAISIRNSTMFARHEPAGLIVFPGDDPDDVDLVERARRADVPAWKPYG